MTFLNTCIFDHGAIQKLQGVLKGHGVSKPFIITDPGIKAAGLLDTVLGALGGEPGGIFADTVANPTENQAIEVTELYKSAGADGIIALGGGSSMDLSKAVGLLAAHGGPLEKYAAMSGGSKHIGKLDPLIAIPTTAGTGSEVSVGMITTLNNGRKETFASPNLIPPVAICDPDLTLGLPKMMTAATGMDAVTHCIEAILVPASNPPAEGIGYDGLTRAVGDGWLRRAVQDGSDKEARWHMMMASYEGALAFVKGLGSVHALSHAAGRLHDKKLHHGTLNAIFLPHLLRFNDGSADGKYERLRFAMGLKPGADLAEAIEKLNEDIGIPSTLKEIGLDASDGPGVVEYALADLAHRGNAKTATQADYEKIYELALG
ncbi:iron-containing alcohol dehydrogenase [Henriciella barbarensis]|uniref:Iron-containing alcohol dehydrogenase n=2 Tax=Henriciella barbarensis TaxID=86342 RepID=A0A399QXS1_9PROT|nr:iron-containing alcohol dehydrogenase [Henriciella barbarensis]